MHNEALKEENWVVQGEHLARYNETYRKDDYFFFKGDIKHDVRARRAKFVAKSL